MDRTRVCSVEQGRKDGSVSIGERARVPPIDLTRAAGGGGGGVRIMRWNAQRAWGGDGAVGGWGDGGGREGKRESGCGGWRGDATTDAGKTG